MLFFSKSSFYSRETIAWYKQEPAMSCGSQACLLGLQKCRISRHLWWLPGVGLFRSGPAAAVPWGCRKKWKVNLAKIYRTYVGFVSGNIHILKKSSFLWCYDHSPHEILTSGREKWTFFYTCSHYGPHNSLTHPICMYLHPPAWNRTYPIRGCMTEGGSKDLSTPRKTHGGVWNLRNAILREI